MAVRPEARAAAATWANRLLCFLIGFSSSLVTPQLGWGLRSRPAIRWPVCPSGRLRELAWPKRPYLSGQDPLVSSHRSHAGTGTVSGSRRSDFRSLQSAAGTLVLIAAMLR